MIRLTIIPKQHPTHSYKVLRLKRYLLTLQGCVDQAAFLCNCPNELDISPVLIKSSIVKIQRLLLVLVWPLMHVCLLFFMVKWQSKQTKMTKNKEHRVPLPHVMTHISNSWIHHISANWLLHKLFSFQTICYQWKKFWQPTQFAAYQSLPGKWYQSLPGSDQQAVTLVREQWPL